MKLYQISCGNFTSVFCNDKLPDSAVLRIKSLQKKFVRDEYAGYCPEQQKIRKEIEDIVKNHDAFVEILYL